jgi:hypothetical protein
MEHPPPDAEPIAQRLHARDGLLVQAGSEEAVVGRDRKQRPRDIHHQRRDQLGTAGRPQRIAGGQRLVEGGSQPDLRRQQGAHGGGDRHDQQHLQGRC